MMKVLCGIDIVDVKRIKNSILRNGFKERVFTESEISYCEKRKKGAYESYAARFAVKEAFAKAVGTGIAQGLQLKDIEVSREEGKPELKLHNSARLILEEKGEYTMDVSISHTSETAAACVVIIIF
jgi:holo-[acyl-carrier protein] synthase